MRHERVSQLLRAFSKLKNPQRLEFRGLKEFIDKGELKEPGNIGSRSSG